MYCNKCELQPSQGFVIFSLLWFPILQKKVIKVKIFMFAVLEQEKVNGTNKVDLALE